MCTCLLTNAVELSLGLSCSSNTVSHRMPSEIDECPSLRDFCLSFAGAFCESRESFEMFPDFFAFVSGLIKDLKAAVALPSARTRRQK